MDGWFEGRVADETHALQVEAAEVSALLAQIGNGGTAQIITVNLRRREITL